MPFVLLVVLVAVAISAVRGGRLRDVAEAPLHHGWLLALGVALQVGVDVAAARDVLVPGAWWTYALLLLSQLLVVGWVVANRHLPGLVLVAAGLAANALVMAANGAMPVSPEAIAALGIEGAEVPPGKHMLLDADTRLPWLADIIPVPPIRSIISVGDLVLAAGLVPLTHALMTWSSRADREPATEAAGEA
ncbi:DUF5317 domain-containing protein [Egicoccus sp. AB-alg6-2]|uniref:DUF5317 domain-containing protein n=1 Tax=Egicoccus sp. AB-alg6-2 TaxID=3242692 RepID=UPI00359DD4A1